MIKPKHIDSKIDIKKHPKLINEETLEVIDVYCSFFGCNQKLTSQQKLFGDRCPEHPVQVKQFFNGKL